MPQTTTINRSWLIKMGVFIAVLIGLGLWGLFDALIAYPNRGRKHAEFAEWQYLEQASQSGLMIQASTPNPVEELARLRTERESIESDPSLAEPRRQMQLTRLDWLTALHRVGDLDPANTVFDDPRARLNELEASWQSKTAPKPLGAYDIPLQWVIVAAGFGGGLWIVALLFSASRRVYTYDPEKMALTLPNGGRTITPADIKEVDKRKWDKFFVFFHMKDDSPEIKLDLLRYKGLEEWVLEMEKHTEGYEPPPVEAEQPAAVDSGEPPANLV